MTYDVYLLTEVSHEDMGEYAFAKKMGELTPAANDDCCYFGSLKLWSRENGFITGQIRDGNFLLISRS